MDNFKEKMALGDQMEMTGEYAAFVEKFKPKKTTDDCYTPDNVYAAVLDWAVKEYGLEGARIIRPFYPGGDYKKEDYSGDCAVIDNPPFSILAEICRWYNQRGIRFFLFGPAKTLFAGSGFDGINYVICDADIMYDNGATVRTGFITNMGQYKITVAPDLHEAIKAADDENRKAVTKSLPKYDYPDHVLTAARIQRIAKYGQSLRIRAEDCAFIRALDSQRGTGKAVFGGGFLLSEKAAAEKAAAEKAAAEKAAAEKAAAEKAAAEKAGAKIWELSEREKEIIRRLG